MHMNSNALQPELCGRLSKVGNDNLFLQRKENGHVPFQLGTG